MNDRKEIRLLSLTLDNFKGCAHRTLTLNGRNADIYGGNATGKTTLYDALTWLLFGKDSKGKSDFEIKPLDEQNNIRDHAAITSVEAELSVGGEHCTFQRIYHEVWTTRRGRPDAEFSGNTSEFFVNGVPCQKTEYTKRVAQLADEKIFRLLTGVNYFAETLPWQERRATLFELSGVADDQEIMASDAQFAPLAEATKSRSFTDCKKIAESKRKLLNRERGDIPARLDENGKLVEELTGIDFAALEAQYAAQKAKRGEAAARVTALEQDAAAQDAYNRMTAAQNVLDALENENAAYRLAQQKAAPPDNRAALRQQRSSLVMQGNRLKRDLEYLSARAADLEGDISRYRAAWDEADKRVFTGGNCPTCGQPLPPEMLEQAKAKFEHRKSDEKEAAVRAADQAKKQLAARQTDITDLEKQLTANAEEQAAVDAKLKEAEATPVSAPVADMPDYAARHAALEADFSAAVDAVNAVGASQREAKVNAAADLADAEAALQATVSELAKKAQLERAQAREQELREQQSKIAEELEDIERLLHLMDEFTRYKARFVEGSVNRRFDFVKWKLFSEQVNGGLDVCCEATVDGVPYQSLNSAARTNAGVDIIHTLSRHYGVSVPLFVDGAESVTDLLPAGTQVIRLIVSKADKELRCELV